MAFIVDDESSTLLSPFTMNSKPVKVYSPLGATELTGGAIIQCSETQNFKFILNGNCTIDCRNIPKEGSCSIN